MGKYRFHRTDIIRDEEAKEIVDKIVELRDKAMVSMLYVFGCRPAELIMLRPQDFDIKEDKIFVSIPTKKKRKKKSMLIEPNRRLWWHVNDYFIQIILDYIGSVEYHDQKLWEYGSTDKSAAVIMNRKVKSIKKDTCLYLFRHSRKTQFDEAGAESGHKVWWFGWADDRPDRAYGATTKKIIESIPIKPITFDNTVCETSEDKRA